ncbi:MAG: ISL3 family transposase [Christiangramia sp.]
MRNSRLWRDLLGVEKTIVDDVEFDAEHQRLVVSVRPIKAARDRCGLCHRRSPRYDAGGGRRRWRGLDFGTGMVWVEADAPRVSCRVHGVVVASVPWARHGAGHTYAFDATAAYLATQAAKSMVVELLRVAWRTVGSIIARVFADLDATSDRLEGLRRIGIDEISYKRGHKYLMVVVDHDRRALVWAAPGRDKATVAAFFDELGPDRCAQITHVSADGAAFIADVVADKCRNAVQCADPFHIVSWATDALDEVRRQVWNEARALARAEPRRPRGRPRADAPPRPASELAGRLKGARYALWKNPANLTEHQTQRLAWIATTSPKLHRAYLLKEGLRLIFQMGYDDAVVALDKWLIWARRCQIPAFIDLAAKITRHRVRILAAIEHNLSNALIESTNTKVRLITRKAYGFKSPDALIALAMLTLGPQQPALPGRK